MAVAEIMTRSGLSFIVQEAAGPRTEARTSCKWWGLYMKPSATRFGGGDDAGRGEDLVGALGVDLQDFGSRDAGRDRSGEQSAGEVPAQKIDVVAGDTTPIGPRVSPDSSKG